MKQAQPGRSEAHSGDCAKDALRRAYVIPEYASLLPGYDLTGYTPVSRDSAVGPARTSGTIPEQQRRQP
jgi:hypothetical protein